MSEYNLCLFSSVVSMMKCWLKYPVRDLILVENDPFPSLPAVPSGTECSIVMSLYRVLNRTHGGIYEIFSTNILSLMGHLNVDTTVAASTITI